MLDDDMPFGKAEMVLELTPQGQALGFTIDGLGRVLRNRLNGITAASYPLGVRSADITVKLPDKAMTADFLQSTMMRTPQGQYVPLSDIVNMTSRIGFGSVLRENGLRVLTITGDISEDDPKRAEEIITSLREVTLPRIQSEYGVSYQLAGLSEQEDMFLADAELGFLLALAGIYLTLAWIFSSWTRPVVVMAIIPFGLVGAIYGHHAWGIPLSMFTVIGLIGMTGIIINDSIVLVSTIDEYAEKTDIITAIVDGTGDRLRPVLLTTMTTVLGLAPLLFETSKQAQFLKPTVVTLAYGLGFGLVLVLLLVPSLMAMQRDLSLFAQAFRRMLFGRHRVLAQRLVLWLAVLASAAAFAGSIGYFLVTGRLLQPFAAAFGRFAELPSTLLALVGFAVMVSMICAVAALLGVLVYYWGKRAVQVAHPTDGEVS